jgi:voltage-gated potassium channel
MDLRVKIIFFRLYRLLFSVPFWMLTALCNSAVVLSAFAFYRLEHTVNPQIVSFFDALWWSFATVTTVGYGDITPLTVGGKVIGMLLMVGGTGLFATFTALFANAMLGHDVLRIERSVSRMRDNVVGIQTDIHQEELHLENQVRKLNHTLSRLEKRLDDIEDK